MDKDLDPEAAQAGVEVAKGGDKVGIADVNKVSAMEL